MKSLATLIPVAALFTLMLGCGGSGGHSSYSAPFGVVTFAEGGIGIIDPASQTVGAPVLLTELGTMGGGRFDVAITSDGSTTLVSNFGDSKVFFINTSDPAHPSVLGSVDIGFFAEDIALTPNGRFALVTDGGFSPTVAVIDMASRTLANTYTSTEVTDATVVPPTTYTPMFNSVAVSPDGATVLCADYFAGKLVALKLSDSGTLTYGSHLSFVPDAAKPSQLFRPVNATISPNGQYAIASAIARSNDGGTVTMGFPVVKITAPGLMELVSYNTSALALTGAQSAAFNPSGSKAYLHCVQAIPDPAPATDPYNVIVELNVSSTGVVSEGSVTELAFVGRSQLFGVDTLAMDPAGRFLYVSNPTLSGGLNQLQLLNVNTHAVTKSITFDPIDIDGTSPLEVTMPVGLCFRP